MVVAGPWVTLGCSGGHAPSLCPLSDPGQASPGCSEFLPVVSASEVAAGGWTSLRGPRAAVERARLAGWGGARMGACPRWEQWLPPLTSTGGQCNIKVPLPDCSVPHTLREALGLRNLGQLVIFGTPGGQVLGQVGWGDAGPLENQVCLFVFCLVLFGL